MTTFAASSGAAENTRITLARLPVERFDLFLATGPGQSMQPRLPAHVHFLPLRFLDRPVRPHRDLAALVELYRLCRRWRFDVVHTHNAKDGVLARWAARLAGVPVIVHTLHNVSFRASASAAANRLYAALERATAPFTHALLGVSRETVRAYVDAGIGEPARYRVVYSGLELERYGPDGVTPADARAELDLPPAAAWVGWFGRFNYQKDPLTFVRAARAILDRMPDVRFVMCGDAPLGEDLWPQTDRLARELGIRDRLHPLGFRSDLPRVLRAVDVVLHSSRYEGMGRIACEALASRRPVVGTAVDGMREVIVSDERGGILVPPGEPHALADATVALLRDRARAARLAESGRHWVEQHVSADRMVGAIAAIYDELLVRALPAEHRGQRPEEDREVE
jgi:glycosyltransferase involved in cell wall biosynthesis